MPELAVEVHHVHALQLDPVAHQNVCLHAGIRDVLVLGALGRLHFDEPPSAVAVALQHVGLHEHGIGLEGPFI
jgi:purine nucleoside phosphorylase